MRISILIDVLVEGAVETHFLGESLLDDAHTGGVRVSHNDARLDIGEAHASQCQQQEVSVVELRVALASEGHDIVVLQVDVVIEFNPVITVAVLELDDALHALGDAVVGLVITSLDHFSHHAHVGRDKAFEPFVIDFQLADVALKSGEVIHLAL